jgi:hypothetical protein
MTFFNRFIQRTPGPLARVLDGFRNFSQTTPSARIGFFTPAFSIPHTVRDDFLDVGVTL